MAPNGYNQQNPKCEKVYKASDSVQQWQQGGDFTYQPNVETFLKTSGTIDLQIMEVSSVHHSDSCMCIYIYIICNIYYTLYIFLRFFSLVSYYKILSIVPCAIQ